MAQNAQTAAGPAIDFAQSAPTAPSKDKKTSDPLFGPNIGPCSAGPGWTTSASRKKLITDDLTPEVLSTWIEKSKQSSQPTTTLQALVNLKRPTLRLSPLNTVPEDSQSPQEFHLQHLHGLEFEYDCDAPKCGIYVHLVLSKSHPEAASVPSATNQAQILVFESVVSGGFGKKLTLDEGAVLELGRYDHIPHLPGPPSPSTDDPAKTESSAAHVATATLAPPLDSTASHRHSRRLFNFRRRPSARSAAGPALAVVDADPNNGLQDAKKDKEKEDEEGVRVLIRLAALDEQGTELVSPNEQTTFLHVVRLDPKSQETGGEDHDAEDKKPWVVKVVKREATIGPHTFQLHEIYGLTSSANHQTTTTTATEAHTYPPQAATDEEDPSAECLLCLSSPREVMLIPCRHLVACKECALNMVEFGAGGNITHALEPAVPAPAMTTNSAPAAAAAGGNETTTGAGDTPVITPMAAYSPTGGTTGGTTTIAPVTNTRRKRKAKGWFCPVCRQPYTSLLRITTAAPPAADKEGGDGDDGYNHRAVAGTDAATAGGESETRSGGGLLSGAFGRPGFLRGINLGRNAQAPAPATDVESQAGMTRVGA